MGSVGQASFLFEASTARSIMWNYFALMFLYVVDKDRMQAGQKPDFKPGFLGALTTSFIFTFVFLSELAHIVVLCHFYVWGQDCDRPLVEFLWLSLCLCTILLVYIFYHQIRWPKLSWITFVGLLVYSLVAMIVAILGMVWFLESESCQQTGRGVWNLSLCLMMAFIIWLGITAVLVTRQCLLWATGSRRGKDESLPLSDA